jgi:hypothetical protein
VTVAIDRPDRAGQYAATKAATVPTMQAAPQAMGRYSRKRVSSARFIVLAPFTSLFQLNDKDGWMDDKM